MKLSALVVIVCICTAGYTAPYTLKPKEDKQEVKIVEHLIWQDQRINQNTKSRFTWSNAKKY